MTKLEAVRLAIDAGYETASKGVPWIKEKYDLDISPGTFASYKSNMNDGEIVKLGPKDYVKFEKLLKENGFVTESGKVDIDLFTESFGGVRNVIESIGGVGAVSACLEFWDAMEDVD